MVVFRHVLLCILFCVFAGQTMKSLDIFLVGGTTFSERTLMEFKQDFPDVSLCPTAFGEDRIDTSNMTFQEELELTAIPFNILSNHDFIHHAAK